MIRQWLWALFGCRHRRLGAWFRRDGQDWRTCLGCGVAVLASVQLDGQADGHRLRCRRTQERKHFEPLEPSGIERHWLRRQGVDWR